MRDYVILYIKFLIYTKRQFFYGKNNGFTKSNIALEIEIPNSCLQNDAQSLLPANL